MKLEDDAPGTSKVKNLKKQNVQFSVSLVGQASASFST